MAQLLRLKQRIQRKYCQGQKTISTCKSRQGYGLLEVIIILGMLAVFEVNIAPFFIMLVYRNSQSQVADTGKMFSHQVGFMQSRARYQGTMLLSLYLSPQGKNYKVIEVSKVRQAISLPQLALSCVKLQGPLELSFLPLGLDKNGAVYTVTSNLLPSYNKQIGIQPVTGRVVMKYD